jgi:hypothetical protein
MSRASLRAPTLVAASLACLLAATPAAHAQNSFDLSVHASSDVTPAAIGLPVYPGATRAVKHGDDDAAFDIGFTLGDTRLRLEGIGYDSDDPPDRVLEFYRKALSRYGDVLECDHGRAVGSLSVTSSGLRCSDKGRHEDLNINGHFDSSTSHDLRAGSPDEFRIAGVGPSSSTPSHFVIMYVKTPKDSDSK